MKRIGFRFLITFLLFTANIGFLYPGKVAVLNQLANPYKIKVDDHQLYISEGANIFIYSLKDYHFIKKFGKQGEGPGEFKTNPNTNMGSIQFDIYPDFLVVYSIGRVSFFTKQGEFIKEMHIASSAAGYYKPLVINNLDKYIGQANVLENKIYYTTINIYDAELKKNKELYREKSWFSPGKAVDLFTALRGLVFDVSRQMIFIEKEKASILIFNHRGEKIDSFTPSTEPLRITKKRKDLLLHVLDNTTPFKSFYQRFKHLIEIPSCFPIIRSFFVADHRIYVFSWRKKHGKIECFIYDLKKRVSDRIYLPLKEMNAILVYPYTIRNGKFYQLIENDETGMWELVVESFAIQSGANFSCWLNYYRRNYKEI